MIEVRLPQLSEDVGESLILLWFVSEGDRVKQGDALVEVQTEKAVSEIEAEASGTIREITVKRGDSAKVGEVLAIIDSTENKDGTESKQQEPSEKQEKLESSAKEESKETTSGKGESSGLTRISPRMRKLAKELDVQLEAVNGTGKNGKVIEEDIRRAAGQHGQEEAIPLSGIRGTIAKRMKESLQSSAQLTETAWADVTEIAIKKEQFTDNVGWTALIAKAVTQALGEHPSLNAHITEDRILPKQEINLGFAIDTDDGLHVATIHNADKQSPVTLHEQLTELAEKAKNGKLSKEESSGSTFSITSLGSYRIQFFTPIINPPELAILGVGKIESYLVLRDGEVSERQRLPLSLTFDHRAIDGAPAAQFLTQLIDFLEEPEQLLRKEGDL